MVSLGGIIHPRTFQITDLIGTMAYVFRHESGHQTTRYKNLELGVWGDVLASNDRKSVWAMIDGSIYNALKLKAELKNKGYHFNSDTAAELIIHAYDAWKEEFMPRLNGDFAIALFDEEKETLYIIRDRLGKKNLYWSDQGEYWLFSTEIKGLLSTGGVPQTTSLIGLSSYLTFGFIPQDMSPIKGANKLLPAHYLKINLSRQISIGQYWSYSQHFANKSGSSKQKIYENFGRWFEDAIRISIPQNKEIGVFLLNSLGSAAMTWHLCHFMPRENIHAFSTVDEKNQIESISKMMSLSPHFVTLDTNEVLNELVKIIWYLDEPIADLQLIRTWFLAKAARQTCTII
jgi:asparagine synthase (glutamine-hydrolysing)